jgi:hypothetical protein
MAAEDALEPTPFTKFMRRRHAKAASAARVADLQVLLGELAADDPDED